MSIFVSEDLTFRHIYSDLNPDFSVEHAEDITFFSDIIQRYRSIARLMPSMN